MTSCHDGQLMILLVDDAPTNIQMLNETLKDDYRLFFATSGSEALRMVNQAPPDLIILDVIMPDMDGYEVCRALKTNAQAQDIPIIFITSMRQQEDEVVGLELGAVDYITKPFNPAVVRLRVRNQIELKRQRDLLARLSNLDGLTGIPNRRQFDEMLALEWNRMAREKMPLSLIILDVDHFKRFNDRYGHLAGDSCLRRVAAALAEMIRRPADMVARYGGEEFAAILPGTTLDGAQVVAESMRRTVADLCIEHADSPVHSVVTVSLGVSSVIPIPGCMPNDLLQAADHGLYQAKQEGRDRWIRADCVPVACRSPWS